MPGRPGPRLADPSYFFATSSRYQPQDRVRRRQGGHFSEGLAPECLPQHPESSPIRTAEAGPSTAEMLAEHPELFPLVLNHLLLVAPKPYADPRRKELHR